MKKTLVIIGAGGHGKVAADIALKMNNWEEIIFLDDNKNILTCLGLKIAGTPACAQKYKSLAEFFVAIGSNEIREQVLEKLITEGYEIATLIHPQSIIGIDVQIKCGTVIMAGVTINSSTQIGKGVIINTGSTIDHDNIIRDYAHISPGANLAGGVVIGAKNRIGIGSNIIQGVNICENVIIGAGTVIIKSIKESGTYVGNPGRKIK